MPKAGITVYLQQNVCQLPMTFSNVMRPSRRFT